MTTTTDIATRRRARVPAQLFALGFGAIYFAVGVCGFLVTGLRHFASLPAATFIVFSVNPLHNIVHIVLGAAWLLGARSPATAKTMNVALGVALGLVTVLGFAGLLKNLGIESLGDPDNFLHLASAALSLYFGSAGAESLAARHAVAAGSDPSPWS